MTRFFLVCLLHLLGAHLVTAQSVVGKVIDLESGSGLPYANIEINGDNIVSNADGNFTVSERNNVDDLMLTVSFLGYNTTRVSIAQFKKSQFTVKLQPVVFELETVNISNTKPNADSIMAYVKRHLARNYKRPDKPAKNMLFYRESTSFKPVKLKVDITKSTGFTKNGLKDTNNQLQALTSNLVSHPPQEFTEMLCNYYTATKTVNTKPLLYPKFEVVKAVKLRDKNRGVSLNEMQEMASGILFQHLDSTKYYRIKSGLFGSRDTIPLHKKQVKKNKSKVANPQLTSVRGEVMLFMSKNTPGQYSDLDFVTRQELYDYVYQGAIPYTDNKFVYIIKFKPKKSAAKYAGTLYVCDTDYAIVKASYDLAEGKTAGGVNLKFFLGVKQSDNVSKGTLMFKQNAERNGYHLQYASIETGQYIYLNRPLKFIEITNEDKDVAAFDLKVETNILNKIEYLNMSQSEIAEAEFDKVKESELKYIELEKYDPTLWKEHSAIEPLEEMKKFKVLE